MQTAKIFKHGGSQAVRLPKAFRFDTSEVLIEKRGSDVVLRAMAPPKFKSFAQIGRYLAEKFADGESFPTPPARPRKHERPILDF